MKKPPVVSVIMPAYNASYYIQQAIDSVTAQTCSDWELIIVNDGSTDATASIIANDVNQDSRIRSFYQENGKQGKARNLGIAHAEGEYIAFLDADDLWMPEKLEIQLQEIVEKNVDLVFSDSYFFLESNVSDKSRRMDTPNQYFEGEKALQLFLEGNPVPTLTVLAKKEKMLLAGGFSEKLSIQNAEDYHLWLKLIINGWSFYGSDKTLASYRVHGLAATSDDKYSSKQVAEVFFDLMQRYPEAKPLISKALRKHLQKRYRGRALHKIRYFFGHS